ncbi:putative peptidase family M13 [Trypoxylus dichotomus]
MHCSVCGWNWSSFSNIGRGMIGLCAYRKSHKVKGPEKDRVKSPHLNWRLDFREIIFLIPPSIRGRCQQLPHLGTKFVLDLQCILQPPFYHQYFPRALNFGGIGVVIGHEITHGFDDKGRLFDKDGNLNTWWTEEATEKFRHKAKCIVEQYNSFVVPEVNAPLDGLTTQGENIADNGGLKQAFRAYLQWLEHNEDYALPDLLLNNKQIFFLNFAQVWCGSSRPEAAKNRLKTAVHSPGRFRVIGTLRNSLDFAEAYKCPPGSPMNPINKCTVCTLDKHQLRSAHGSVDTPFNRNLNTSMFPTSSSQHHAVITHLYTISGFITEHHPHSTFQSKPIPLQTWHKGLLEGRERLEDETYKGGKISAGASEMVEKVPGFVENDRNVSLKTMEEDLYVSRGTIRTILDRIRPE